MGGEAIVITRRGEQVARLMPPRASDALGAARDLAVRIRTNRASFGRTGIGTRAGTGTGTGTGTSGTVQPSFGDVSTRGSIRNMIEEGRR
jgi:antitoxin (DNA-binding transcriptional repressor) of toxin-antitoxin stability system